MTKSSKPAVELPGSHALDIAILREEGDGWVLQGSRCPSCSRTFYPPRVLCPDDLNECAVVALETRGTLYGSAVVHLAPHGFEAPYRVAYVDLPSGVRVFAQLRWDGDEQPSRGADVELTVDVVRSDPQVLGPVFVGPVT